VPKIKKNNFQSVLPRSQCQYCKHSLYLLPPPRGNVLPGVCLCLSVSLSVCLLANLRKSYWSHLHENFATDVSVDNEELRFCVKIQEFSKDSSTLPNRTTMAHITQKLKTERIFIKILA